MERFRGGGYAGHGAGYSAAPEAPGEPQRLHRLQSQPLGDLLRFQASLAGLIHQLLELLFLRFPRLPGRLRGQDLLLPLFAGLALLLNPDSLREFQNLLKF